MSFARSSDELRLPEGSRIFAVVSRYHVELTGTMLESARAELLRAGLEERNLGVVWVPGSFELPLVARRVALRDDVDGVVCFGLVLKGETPHNEYIAQAATLGIARAAFEADTPIGFGLLTCDSLEQARARALPAERGGVHDKGREVARAVVGQIQAMREAKGNPRTHPVGFAPLRIAAQEDLR
jgi:6,7-dimethyl-8-ribityllumazine synthase